MVIKLVVQLGLIFYYLHVRVITFLISSIATHICNSHLLNWTGVMNSPG